MSAAQLRRSLLDSRLTVFWYAIGLALYAAVLLPFWPTIRDNQAMYEQFLQAFPKAMVEAFGISEMGTFAGFVGTEFLNIMWPLIAAAFVIMSASSFVAGEIDRGTVELWLSAPERRWRMLAAKELVLVIGSVVLAAVTAAAVGVLGRIVGEDLSTSGVVASAVVLVSFCVAVAGYTSLFSALLSSRGAAAGLAAGVTLASYLAGVVSGLSPDVADLKYLAFTSAFHPQRALTGGDYAGEAAILVAIGLICAVASLVVFERRDANP